MSLNHVLRQFDAIGPMGPRAPITIDQGFTGSNELIVLFRWALEVEAFTIDAITEQTSRATDHLKLVGTATLLGTPGVEVTFLARERDGELVVTLDMLAPPGWSLGSMFPFLPQAATAYKDAISEEPIRDPNLLAQLSLGTTRLVFSSVAYFDEALACELLPGLNLVGELYLEGPLHTLGYFLQERNPLRMHGPIKEFAKNYDPTKFLGIRLHAPLTLDFASLGPLTIEKSEFFLKSAFSEYQTDPVVSATQASGAYLLARATLAGRPLEMVGKYDISSEARELSLRGTFADFNVAGFADLSQTVGVEGFDCMPEEFPKPDGISLTEFGVAFDCINYDINRLLVGVGAPVSWEIIPGTMTLTEVAITFTVISPFAAQGRSMRTTLTGLLSFGRFSLAAYAELPTLRLGAGLPSGMTLPLGDVIESFLPNETELPPLTVKELYVEASPREKNFFLNARIEELLSLPVGATSFEVAELFFLFDYEKGRGSVKAIASAQMQIADAAIVLSGEVDNGLTLSGSLSKFELKKFWSLVTQGEALPEEIPDILFETLSVRVDMKTGGFSVLGNATVEWDHLSAEGAVSANAQFSLTRSVSGGGLGSTVSSFSASLSLQGKGPVPVAEGFTLENFNFLFSYQTGGSWQLSGGMGAQIFDTRLDLQAGYETTQAIQKIKLRASAAPAKKLIDIPGVGAYSFAQFDLLLDRRAVEGGKKKTFYDLRLASTVEIDQLFTLGGYLSISDTSEGVKGLTFKPNPTSTAFHVDFPTGEGVGIDGELFEIGFVKESATAGWSFTGSAKIGITGLSEGFAQALPSKVHAKLVAGKTDVRLSAMSVTDPIDIALPKARGKSLGRVTIQLTELGVAVKPQLGLVLEAGLGLPAELNAYLGAQIFRVYQPGNLLTMSRTRFTISGTGVAMQFVSSPFTAANTVVINGESWFDVDFGQYGAISLKMPTFVYNGVTQYFEAGGGVKVTRPLALPLAPLKLFLEACGGKAMAEVFPDKIPIESLDLVDKNGDLKIDELVAFLKKAGDVPGEVITALKKAGKVLNRFPDGFKHYFNLEIPEHLEFKFGFSPTGRISMGLLAPQTPVRVLFPSVVQSYVPMPGLCGIEVRKFSVGTLMAGSLFYGEVDAIIDQYDVPSLAVSLMLPSNPSFPLPTSDQLQRRIILDDVFCIIPVSQGLPIPLPVFYDELGFQYLGVEGLGLQAHVGFPKPALDGPAAIAIFTVFDEFFTSRKALLNPDAPPGGVDLTFVFHDEFLQAPEYLGGGVLGTKGKTIKVGLWKYIASLLNFGKTFSINEAIGSIPLENRVGSAQYKFAFMKFDADWLFTTPDEFRKGAFQQLKLSASDCDDFMTVLPSVASTPVQDVKSREEGLVAFVRGKADLDFIRLNAAFGLAASGSMGFNTGFKIDGAIGNVIELELSGALMVNAPLATGVAAAPVLQAAVPPAKAPANRALSLSEKDSVVEIPAADSLVLPEYTIELWLKPKKDESREWIDLCGVDTKQNGLRRNHFLAINAKYGFYHHRFTDAGGGNSGPPNTANGSVRWGQWQHVAITNDGVTAKTYVDGKEAASGPVNGALVLFKAPFSLGKVPKAGDINAWNGEVAELRIWKRARGASELERQMTEVLQGDEQDLVSLYRFDKDTGTRAIDVCGRNHGTITSGRFVDSELLMLSGLEFDGKDDYIEVPDSQSLRIGAYTAEVWFKMRQPSQEWAGLFGKRGRNYSLFIHRNGFAHHRFHTARGTNEGAPNTPAGSIRWNRWNHVAITNDGQVARTFINGVKQAEGPVLGNLIIDNEKLSIGRTADGTNSQFFPGEIAEVRLWSRVRSPGELSGSMYRRLDGKDPSLVSLWRFSEATRETLVDACGRNPGRIFMQDTSEPAKLRHDGLVFSGKGDSALIAKSDKFNTGQYTIEAWIRPDRFPTGSWQCIWGGTGNAPKLYLSNKGVVSHRYASSLRPSNVINTDVGLIRFGEWNHVAVTNDGVTCNIFINGRSRLRGEVQGKLVSEPAAINVGRSGDANEPACFRGSIDDLRYWAVARTPEQIAQGMNLPLTGNESGIVAWYNMDHTSGTQLVDLGPNRLHGVVNGAQWALAASPTAQGRAAIQLQGHTHLTVAGRQVMRGDLQLVDDQFWFTGVLDLFPKDWPIRVYGRVDGMVSQQRFYLSGETQNELFGLVLSQSRLFMSNEELRLEGRWLGAYTLLDISWEKNDPLFAGSVGFSASPRLDFGTVRIGGVKVADNVRLSIDIAADVSVRVSRQGFAGDITARFKINGKGFELRLGIDIPPADLEQLFNWIKQKLIDAPEKYLAHLFSDAAAWLKNVGEGAIDFAKDAGEAIGPVLKSAFKASQEQATALMKSAGYAADQVGAALSKGYNVAAREATVLLKGAQYAVEDVSTALKQAYKVGASEAVALLKSAQYGVEDVGAALKNTFNVSVHDATGLLKSAQYGVEEVGQALSSAYKAGSTEALQVLRQVGYAVEDVGRALSSAYKLGSEDAVKLLRQVGYAVEDVSKALSSAYRLGSQDAAKLLKQVGYAVEDVGKALSSVYQLGSEDAVKLLKQVGYGVADVGRALSSAYRLGSEGAARLLRQVGYSAEDVGRALNSAYKVGSGDAVKLLRQVGYGAEGAGRALKSAYSLGSEDAVNVLKQVGTGVEDVGKGLKSAYSLGSEDAARLLKKVGYPAEDVGKALNSAYKVSSADAAKLLKTVGYGLNEVSGAMNTAYGVTGDACKDLLKGAGYATKEVENLWKSGTNIASDAYSGTKKFLSSL